MTLLTDNLQVARGIGARAAELGARFEVLIEIDTGDGRAGAGRAHNRIISSKGPGILYSHVRSGHTIPVRSGF